MNPVRRVHNWLRDMKERKRITEDTTAWFIEKYDLSVTAPAEPTELKAAMFDATGALPKPNTKTAKVTTQLRLDGTGEVDVIHTEENT